MSLLSPDHLTPRMSVARPESLLKRIRTTALIPTVASVLFIFSSSAHADVWVFEPSASVDQRLDDNYRLDPDDSQAVAATRAVASLGLSRENETQSVTGQLRIDGLLAVNEDETDELSSNKIAFLESRFLQRRSSLGFKLSFKQDTPNRDISADLTDLSQTASDTGASVTQDQNVERERLFFNPSYTYSLSRRTELEFDYSFTGVNHGLPSCEDAINDWVESGGQPEDVFTVVDELDNFEEHALQATGKYKLSPIDQVYSTVGFSRFEAEEEVSTDDFNEKTPDERCRNVLRNPRDTTSVNTSRFSLGYERLLSPTLNVGVQLGYYVAESDKFGERSDTAGYLANISIAKNTGATRYTGKLGVDVYPSDIGDVVESLQLVGDMRRQLSHLLDFSFRARIYEPDALSDENDNDEFARRFLSLEPRLIWRFTRAWTLAGSYRYRRQKSQTNPNSAVSNAVLLSLKYTPPSAIRDLQKQK